MPEEPRIRSGVAGGDSPQARHLRQVASEMILSASNLTDKLTDDEAQPLVKWGVMQAEAAADDLARATEVRGDSPGREVSDVLADLVNPVRRVMKRINRLAADRHDLGAEELLGELRHLFSMAENLPHPSLMESPAGPLAELCVRQAGLENGAFVQAVLNLFQASHRGGELGRSLQLDLGG